MELVLERIEVPLLHRTAGAHRFDRLTLQGAMHALVCAVVWRTAGSTPLGQDAQTHPPHVEVGHPTNGLRREEHDLRARLMLARRSVRMLADADAERPQAPLIRCPLW